jgi:tetratricopeptide (TPR) repeat protein
MFKSPWFTLVVGLMVGLAVGYVTAERQPIPPGKALRLGLQQAAGPGEGLPEGHPPIGSGAAADPETQGVNRQIAELQNLLAQNPGDVGLMIALGNANFDAERWQDARVWYERALTDDRRADPNTVTDLAVVYRNLGQPQRSLELLDRAIALDDNHWQAWYNKVVVLHFDLHQHDAALQALRKLQSIAVTDSQVPDLAAISREVEGS